MTRHQASGAIPAHWLLRVILQKPNQEPLYVEVTDANQDLEHVLGPAWEALHLVPPTTIVTQHGKVVDLHQPVSSLAFSRFYSGNDKWGVVEISLKPRPEVPSGGISVCGDLPMPGGNEPAYSSAAVLTQGELLACVEEVLLVKSRDHRYTSRYTLIKDVLQVLETDRHVIIETERVQRAIDTIVQKFNLSTTALRINLTGFLTLHKK